MKADKLFVVKVMSVDRDKIVARKGCVRREVQQQMLQDATSVERAKRVSREVCVN
jgi:hypothetical protein